MANAPAPCSRCGERPADPAETPWLFHVGLFLLTIGTSRFGRGASWPEPDALCAQCAGGYHFLGLLMLVAFLAVGFVFAVILLA